MKRSSIVVLAVMLAGPCFAARLAAQSTRSDTVVEEIVARVNNNIITRADLRRSREQLLSDAQQQDPNNPAPDPKEREKDLLRDLIDQQLLLQKGQDLGLSADTDVVKKLDELRKQMHAESMEELEKAAQAQGVSFEDFKQNLKNSIITQKVISQEVGGHINVSQAEIQQFYDQHKSEMDRPEQVRLSEILISTQSKQQPKNDKGQNVLPEQASADVVEKAHQQANDVYAMLQKGGKFDEVARKYSQGPTAGAGGDLEYFKRGTLSKELEEKVFALKPGEYTEPVRTNQGWVILKVTEHYPAGVPPLKDVQNQIQEQVYMTKMQPALREYLTKLREEAYIDVKPGFLDTGASPNETQPIYTTANTETVASKNGNKKHKKLGLF